jgi:hypothetical protein
VAGISNDESDILLLREFETSLKMSDFRSEDDIARKESDGAVGGGRGRVRIGRRARGWLSWITSDVGPERPKISDLLVGSVNRLLVGAWC